MQDNSQLVYTRSEQLRRNELMAAAHLDAHATHYGQEAFQEWLQSKIHKKKEFTMHQLSAQYVRFLHQWQ